MTTLNEVHDTLRRTDVSELERLPLRVCYATQGYISHQRTARSYKRILERRCTLLPLERYTEADVVIIHLEPHDYDALYRQFPPLAAKRVIANVVWEASEIPDCYKRSIARVAELWTCSHYCLEAFRRHHPHVYLIPYVIEREMTCTDDDIAFVKHAIGYQAGRRYFVNVARRWGGHKNPHGLAAAFSRQRSRMPHARLVLKGREAAPPGVPADSHVIWIGDQWTDGHLTALYRCADVYVSAHHGEGWGLTMSDGMLFGIPVLATGYSGNVDYMHAGNSWLIEFDERRIRDEDQYLLYTNEMKWAYPDEQDLERKLRWLYDALDSAAVAERVNRATADIVQLGPRAVEDLMIERLREYLPGGES
jgi:glycosyltransferase involved in cell wall biosynthesis